MSQTLEITVRSAQPADLEAGSRILYESFQSYAEQRSFEPDYPSLEIATSMSKIFLNHPKIYGVVAESEGDLIGLGFLNERNEVRSIGPVAVHSQFQNHEIARILVQKLLERAKEAQGIRLVQDTANPMSVALYESVGFNVKEPLFLMYGIPQGDASDGYNIRPMREADLPACNELCYRIHGFDRAGELADAISHFGAVVLIRRGRIVAYASAPSLWIMNHGVAETEKDLKALLMHAGLIKETPISLLVPGRNNDFFRWCLSAGLHIAKPMTLMSMGFYQEPKAPWYPSVEY